MPDSRQRTQTPHGLPPRGLRLLLVLLIAIFIAEAAIMALTQEWGKHPWSEILLDPILLVLIITPAVYWLVLRPMSRQYGALETATGLLRDNEEKFRIMTASAHDAIIMLDNDGRVSFWNDAAQRMLGYSAGEICGRHLYPLLPERYRQAHEQGFHEFRSSGTGAVIGKTVELAALRKDGTEFPIELSVAAMMYRGAWHAIGIIRDISERKQTEQELQLGALVMQSAAEGIIAANPQGLIEKINPAFSVITGYSEEEVIGKNPRLLHSGRQDQEFYRTMWRTLIHSGHWEGEIWNRRKNGAVYPEWLSISAIRDAHGKVINYVGIFSDITQRKRTEQHLEKLAFYDPLTGLPNRQLFEDRLDQALRQAKRTGRLLAIFFLDLDYFKQVNDNYGHDVGDLLLQQAAQRMQALLREEDTVGRFGGDEFALLLQAINDDENAIQIARKIIATLGRPFDLAGQQCHIGASIGISLYPVHGAASELLLKHADSAMYRAKQQGRNRYQLYEHG